MMWGRPSACGGLPGRQRALAIATPRRYRARAAFSGPIVAAGQAVTWLHLVPAPCRVAPQCYSEDLVVVNRLLILPLLATSLCAAEITTGVMLGKHYDPRAFYVRNGPGESWQK